MKQDEIAWFSKMTEEEIENSVNLPFVDTWNGGILADVGAILYLLPPAPAVVLDVGVGGGWSSWFYAKAGYTVTGIDISPDWVRLVKKRWKHPNLSYLCADFESLSCQYGAIVMHDTLHHADDPLVWVKKAYELLVPGGVLITCEPGSNHPDDPNTRAAVERLGVNENAMGVMRVKDLGERAGFSKTDIFPSAKQMMYLAYIEGVELNNVYRMDTGIVRLTK